jgi:hypothetical protein
MFYVSFTLSFVLLWFDYRIIHSGLYSLFGFERI